LSGLVFNLFSPCLFLTKLTNFSFAEILRMWPLTANMIITHVVGAALGAILMRVAACPRGLQRHVMLAMAVGESDHVPSVLGA